MNGNPKPASLVLWAVVLLLTGLGLPGAEAQGLNQVGLVVQFGDGSYTTRCIEFSEPQISGYDVLLRSGLNIEASVSGSPGVLICGIEGTGCSVSNCMCDFPPNYWSYWHLVDGEWLYSQMGASGYMVSSGEVEGWNWGEGQPPVVIPLEQICAPPATNTPTPTQTPTPSSTPTATWTPLPPTATPTWTPLPPTATSTPLPTWTPTPIVPPTAIPATVTIAPSATLWPSATAALPAADTSTPVPPTATATPTWTPPPPTITPEKATETATTASGGTGPPPSPTPSATPASPTPLPTQLAVATRPVTPALTITVPRPGVVETPQSASRLPTLLALGAGLAYVFFILFAVLLVALFVIVRVRQR